MSKTRLEAFSDCVLSIIITVMVIDLHVPHGADFAALAPVVPLFFCYVVSFVCVGTYWNNHHHMLHATRRINGPILWANLHLLFWLSLVPITTGWLGENPFDPWPAAIYGVIMTMASVAYLVLERAIMAFNGRESILAAAVGTELKGKVSTAIYLAAIVLAFVKPWISEALYAVVAVLWVVPDPRIERAMAARPD